VQKGIALGLSIVKSLARSRVEDDAFFGEVRNDVDEVFVDDGSVTALAAAWCLALLSGRTTVSCYGALRCKEPTLVGLSRVAWKRDALAASQSGASEDRRGFPCARG
jgi:hypothetical protein